MERPEIVTDRTKEKYCTGVCRHGSSYHQAKWFDKSVNDYKYGCCMCECPCMEYKPPPEPQKAD